MVFVFGAGALQGYKAYDERYRLLPCFTRNRYDPARIAARFEAGPDARTSGGISTSEQNLVVYQGFSPFVGAGFDLGGWSFAVDVTRPKDSLENETRTVPFKIPELYARLQEKLGSLGFQGLSIKDCLFVNGTDLGRDRSILHSIYGRPVQQVNPETMKRYATEDSSRIRHYQWIRVHDWGNDLILSHFLRCSLKAKNLFVEFDRFLLTPLESQYRQVDSLPPRSWGSVLALGAGSLISGPILAAIAWLVLLAKGLEFVNRFLGFGDRRRRSEIKNNPLFNYGVAASIRESLNGPWFVHYFQKLDKEMYAKILEREILDAIIEFLDDHNIDTSEFKERETTILNSGIIVQGGNVEAQSLAVGAGAQATTAQQQPTSLLRRVGRAR